MLTWSDWWGKSAWNNLIHLTSRHQKPAWLWLCSCMVDLLKTVNLDFWRRDSRTRKMKHCHLFSRSAEAGEAVFRVSGDVLGRRRQQRRLQRLLRSLLQLAQRRRGAALPATDGGRGRGAEPLLQRQLVWEERGTAGTAELAQEPEDAQVRCLASGNIKYICSQFLWLLVHFQISFILLMFFDQIRE